ncbi:IS1595 family transposase [Candidatus Peregrinibacteria bacterium]|nr:MAG: IS1595 family transposase [Candidatus Peregrinibacteria bacterium]
MAMECEQETKLSGEIEVDESYFVLKRVRGKRGRGATGKTPVVGLLKRDGKVFTKIIERCDRRTLHSFIQRKIETKSIIHSDGWKKNLSS